MADYTDNLVPIDIGSRTLMLGFTCPPLGVWVITAECYESGGSKPAGKDEATIEPGTDVNVTFAFDGLSPDTKYFINVFEGVDGRLLANAEFTTLPSSDAPKFKRFSVKVENGKINYTFEIGNLDQNGTWGNFEYYSWVTVSVDNGQIQGWNGDDIVIDDYYYEPPRGTLTVTGSCDFPEKDSCEFKVYAKNFCVNLSTGTDIYDESTFRETTLTIPFAWTIPKKTGENIRLAASEWNNFIGRIKKRLQSTGVAYSKAFTTAVSGGLVGRNVGTAADGLSIDSPKVISKSILCEAVDALNAMLPEDERISYPTGISASFLNNIVDKLNSI